MSPTVERPVDTDVAVLKSQVGELQTSLSSMRDSVNTQLSHLTARFDIFAELVRDMTRMQEKQTSQSETMGRAFGEIRQLRDEIGGHLEARDAWRATHERETQEYRDRIIAERDAYRKEHDDKHRSIETKANRAHGWILGAGACVVIIVAMLGWIGNRALDTLDATAEKAAQNETELLRHKLDEANEKIKQGTAR